MCFSETINSKNKSQFRNIYENLNKGSCVKIKNSKKVFQVIGFNLKNKICWLREWPIDFDSHKTFALDISQITIKTFCPNKLSNFTND